MHYLRYDGSFEGLFTAIFEVFEYRYTVVEISSEEHWQNPFFGETHEVITDSQKAERVLKKIEKNLGKQGIHELFRVYLSEDAELERLILEAVRLSIQFPTQNILNNFANENMLKISKLVRSVGRESHRMNAFVRFELLEDGFFFSKISPDFNVLPLIKNHFKERYKDQKWMIYDERRNYGIIFDLNEVDFFYPSQEQTQFLQQSQFKIHEAEVPYQKLWQNYFTKTNIVERKNDKLHRQHVPKRYWKYLTEKKL